MTDYSRRPWMQDWMTEEAKRGTIHGITNVPPMKRCECDRATLDAGHLSFACPTHGGIAQRDERVKRPQMTEDEYLALWSAAVCVERVPEAPSYLATLVRAIAERLYHHP